MDTEQVLVKVPWKDVAIVVSRLIKFSKGGISKDEAKELVSLIALLGAQVSLAIGPELSEAEPVSKKRKK